MLPLAVCYILSHSYWYSVDTNHNCILRCNNGNVWSTYVRTEPSLLPWGWCSEPFSKGKVTSTEISGHWWHLEIEFRLVNTIHTSRCKIKNSHIECKCQLARPVETMDIQSEHMFINGIMKTHSPAISPSPATTPCDIRHFKCLLQPVLSDYSASG